MNNQHGYYLEDLTIGMESSYQKTITETDIDAFAALTGDTAFTAKSAKALRHSLPN